VWVSVIVIHDCQQNHQRPSPLGCFSTHQRRQPTDTPQRPTIPAAQPYRATGPESRQCPSLTQANSPPTHRAKPSRWCSNDASTTPPAREQNRANAQALLPLSRIPGAVNDQARVHRHHRIPPTAGSVLQWCMRHVRPSPCSRQHQRPRPRSGSGEVWEKVALRSANFGFVVTP